MVVRCYMRMRLSKKQVGRAGRSAIELLISMLLLAGLASAGSVGFTATDLHVSDGSGREQYQIVWTVFGDTFLTNYQLDIRFDPSLYGAISNGVAPAGFTVQLLQPNNPPGTFGDYKAEANSNMASFNTTGFQANVFSVNPPVSQLWAIDLLDNSGAIISVIDSGITFAIPEPATLPVAGMALLLTAVGAVRRRRRAVRQS